MSLMPTVGARGGTSYRLEIHDLVKNVKYLTLYVRALHIFQGKDQRDPGSWFQVCGIHGLPHQEYAMERPSLNTYDAGYCTHGHLLFPTWHRPYVALFEQFIQKYALEAAQKFTVETQAWIQAAQELRQPFYDWCSNPIPPDELIKNDKIQIIDYNGHSISVDNPLRSYEFHPIDPSFSKYPNFGKWPKTVRNPKRNGQEDIPGLIKKLQNEADQIKEKAYNMLKFSSTWDAFSNHGEGDDTHANSLESCHDDIHALVGYGEIPGHMTIVEVAAFDPWFSMHHCNVDRLFAIWSALHIGVWVSPGVTVDATMSIASGAKVTEDTPLDPFYVTEKEPWTSKMLKDHTKLNYDYPDFKDVARGSPELIRDYMENLVDEKYGHPHPTSEVSGTVHNALKTLANFKGVTEDHSKDRLMWDWVIKAKFQKFELNDSFLLRFYYSADGGSVDKRESFIGSIGTFRGTTPEDCANCRDNEGMVQEGVVHLNRSLAHGNGSFEPEDVRKYLEKMKLTCLVSTNEPKVLSSLQIEVKGVLLKLPAHSTRPIRDTSQAPIVFNHLVSIVQAQ